MFLNIWTPLSANATKTSLPVFIFIHGGSFETGSGSIGVIDGPALSNSLEAVVVTFNYRLSVFGFPGVRSNDFAAMNPGFLDQQLALNWIHSNIQAFGGDPEMVLFIPYPR